MASILSNALVNKNTAPIESLSAQTMRGLKGIEVDHVNPKLIKSYMDMNMDLHVKPIPVGF